MAKIALFPLNYRDEDLLQGQESAFYVRVVIASSSILAFFPGAAQLRDSQIADICYIRVVFRNGLFCIKKNKFDTWTLALLNQIQGKFKNGFAIYYDPEYLNNEYGHHK